MSIELTIFAKRRTNKEGKPFTGYLTTLTRRDGTSQTVGVKFRIECGAPDAAQCPCIINVEKNALNMARRDFVNEKTGEAMTGYTLWISAWTMGRPYEDHSLDDFEFGTV